MEKQAPLIQKLTLYLLFFILLVYILVEAKHILYPIAFGILIAYVLFPASRILEEKLKFPRALAILLCLIVSIGIIYGIVNIIVSQFSYLIKDFPVLKKQALVNFVSIQSFIEHRFGITNEAQDIWIKEQISKIFEGGDEFGKVVFSKATGTLGSFILMPIFAFFMLFYRDRARNFIMQIVAQKRGKLTENLLKQISKVTIKYVTGIMIVVVILSISHSIALSLMGLKFAIIIGIVSGLFSFIPYFGTIASSVIPILFALMSHENPLVAVWILCYYIGIMFIDHNILTPTIVGGNVHLNPFITILSIIIGGMIWGIPGMVVIVPTIAIIKIICDNVDGLAPWGYILGGVKNKVPLEKLRKLVTQRQQKSEKL
jgi:predicted PurR-regulated permease PerM